MMNMSYCRMENTCHALDECIDSINSGERISPREFRYFKSMFKEAIKFCYDNGILDDDDDGIDFDKISSRFDEWRDELIERDEEDE